MASDQPQPDIRIDLSDPIGTLNRQLHGVNNGPVTYGSLVDVSHHYTELRLPLVRIHDPNWPHAREVDIYVVFPDPDADPDDPASYDFTRTDEYLRGIRETGAEVMYRLGVSIEHTRDKVHIHPPADPERWARICLGIVNHYNHGWADGFEGWVRYWEVWCEPDHPGLWTGTPEQYHDLYRATVTTIKAAHPEELVGGPTAAYPRGTLIPGFVAYCAERSLPIDFLSWHTYTDSIDSLAANARHVADTLHAAGYPDTELILDEWNYVTGAWDMKWLRGNEQYRRVLFERQKSIEGASFVAGALIALQDLPVDVATYYDGQPTALYCGLFDIYGVPQKTFHAFRAYRTLVETDRRLAATVSPEVPGIYVLAGEGPDGALVLISNHGGRSRFYTLDIAGLEPGATWSPDLLVLDGERDLEPAHPATCKVDGTRITMYIPSNTVLLLSIAQR